MNTKARADALVARGNAWLRHGYWSQALTCYEQALTLADGHREAALGIDRPIRR